MVIPAKLIPGAIDGVGLSSSRLKDNVEYHQTSLAIRNSRIPVCFLVALVSACSVTSEPAWSDKPEPLTVMSWNLEWFFDENASDNYSKLAKEKSSPTREDWEWRRDAVASAVANANPTILALQEIENQRVLWYLTRSLDRNHSLKYDDLFIQGRDFFTEQDVGMLFRTPADAVMISQMRRTAEQTAGSTYFDVSKHLLAVFEFPVGESTERVTVMNVHLRSKLEGLPLRIRQARLIHKWLSKAIANGENVILLGDTNSEERGNVSLAKSDLGVAAGFETPQLDDDLVDLHFRIPANERQTHLLANRQFDRILVSPSLIEDDPKRPDLVFENITVARELSIQGKRDEADDHWERYWQLPSEERDLSDHYPVIATFGVH